jgi:hypothetical protein
MPVERRGLTGNKYLSIRKESRLNESSTTETRTCEPPTEQYNWPVPCYFSVISFGIVCPFVCACRAIALATADLWRKAVLFHRKWGGVRMSVFRTHSWIRHITMLST